MANATKTKNKKPNWFRRVGAKVKEVFSELKRDDVAHVPDGLEDHRVVLVIVFIFLVITTGVDAGFAYLLDLIS